MKVVTGWSAVNALVAHGRWRLCVLTREDSQIGNRREDWLSVCMAKEYRPGSSILDHHPVVFLLPRRYLNRAVQLAA